MSHRRRFLPVLFLLCLVPANPCLGVEGSPNQEDSLKKPPQATDTTRKIPAMTSGNGTATASEKKENEEQKSDAESEKSDERKGAKDTPLKEFVPSEKIKADQAVDFPSDI